MKLVPNGCINSKAVDKFIIMALGMRHYYTLVIVATLVCVDIKGLSLFQSC